MKRGGRALRRPALGLALLVTACVTAAGPAPAQASGPAAGRGDHATAAQVATERKARPNVWWYVGMGLPDIHKTATGKGVKVAVIDGYLDPTVPDLRGAKISKGDSCRGHPVPYLSGELASHGTAMTTAIVGQGADGKGIVGVAPDAELRFYSFDDDPDQSLVECDAILIRNQIDKAVAWGADVISMSIGTGTGLEESIEKAWKSGAVVVAASGAREPDNERAVEAIENPAAMPGVVAAAASTPYGKIWKDNPYSFEADDIYLSLAAPGVDVPLGGFPEGSDEWLIGGDRTGTSPATAILAGEFAVLKSRWPEATNNQLIQAAIHNASGREKKGELVYDKVQGYGIMKLELTLEQDPAGWPDENPLLVPPREAKKLYPASSYDADRGKADDGEQGETAAEDEGTSAQAGSDTTSSSGEEPATEDGTAVPVWAVVLAVLVLLALAAGAFLLRRRSSARRPASGTTAPDATHTTDTTHDHPAPRGS